MLHWWLAKPAQEDSEYKVALDCGARLNINFLRSRLSELTLSCIYFICFVWALMGH